VGGGAGLPGTNGWGSTQCPAAADAGFEVGQALGSLVVNDCDTGEQVTLDELCGASATWIFTAHTHCPTCKATAQFSDTVAQAMADKNVAIAHIVYDDNGTTCAQWRDAYKLGGIANLKVYEDLTGQVWAKLKTSNYTAPSAFLDRNRVVTYKAHGLTQSAVLKQLESALAQ
jgi:thiol-disulfide isomerase/thioredoxin